jgi:hypothetical protein
MYVSSMEKLLVFLVTSKHMKELSVERSPLHVSNVEKPSIGSLAFKDIYKLTLSRNLMYVSNLESFYFFQVPQRI